MVEYCEIERLNTEIKILIDRDDKVAKELFDALTVKDAIESRRDAIRVKLRDLRKDRLVKLNMLRHHPEQPRTGRRRSIPLSTRRKQVAEIKQLRAQGLKWEEVASQIGKHYTECLRILRVFDGV
ncbi:MAG: hypothetical protein JEZ11_03995 [Desulfobacterales bacterium]|nr:hypothetical protein [Desulfobacterales bacterium]